MKMEAAGMGESVLRRGRCRKGEFPMHGLCL